MFFPKIIGAYTLRLISTRGHWLTMQQTFIPSQPELTPRNNMRGNTLITGRILKIVYILYSIEAGIFLILLPWMNLWDTNILTYLYPQFLPVITNPFFKGAVLGLGIANIIIGAFNV